MNSFNQKSCAMGCAVLTVILILGIAIGGGGMYLLRDELNYEAHPLVNSLPKPVAEPVSVPVPTQPQPQMARPSMVTQQSDSVKAVEKMLPTVVTVVATSSFGQGSGSGFFISQDGYIVTNNHVVEGSNRLQVVYAQGGIAQAKMIGTAPEFDLAVLKVDDYVPTFASWGDSGELPLGSPVIAIGSALGEYRNTVTGGMLSGFNRELGGLKGLLQTDAAINHGNSGGPLINSAGQVIGINTLVARGGPSDAVGLGFAIPSNIARNVVQQLIERGVARPPFLGIKYRPLNPQLATQEGLSLTEGAYITTVVRGTPASQAGLQAGDVISKISGQVVDDRQQLVSLLFEHVAGETIAIEFLRDGVVFETSLTLVEREE